MKTSEEVEKEFRAGLAEFLGGWNAKIWLYGGDPLCHIFVDIPSTSGPLTKDIKREATVVNLGSSFPD
jgi:hypothetical protein